MDDGARSLVNGYIEFHRRPTPIPAVLRPTRRLPLLLLLVEKCYGSTASWKGLQLLNWATKSDKHMDVIIATREHQPVPDRPIVRFEPALDRAIDLAAGLGLVEVTPASKVRLAARGRAVLDSVRGHQLFIAEEQRLERLPGRVTQAEVERLLEWRVR